MQCQALCARTYFVFFVCTRMRGCREDREFLHDILLLNQGVGKEKEDKEEDHEGDKE